MPHIIQNTAVLSEIAGGVNTKTKIEVKFQIGTNMVIGLHQFWSWFSISGPQGSVCHMTNAHLPVNRASNFADLQRKHREVTS